jgi:hypothetical protein
MSEDSVKVTKTQTKFENGKLTFKTGYVFTVTDLFPTFAEMNDGQKYTIIYGLKQAGQDFTATEPGEGWTKVTWQAMKLDKLALGESPSTRKAAAGKEPSITLSSLEGNALKLAVSTKSDVPINTLLALGAITTVRHSQLHAEFLSAMDAVNEDPTAE